MNMQVSREPPQPTAKQLAAQQKEEERQAKERAREACQQQLAAAIEAGELEALREAIEAADLAGCSASLLKQARGRRDALRKAARRLERQTEAEEGLPAEVANAAFRGNAHAVSAWLDEGVSVDARCAERYSATLLLNAALGGHKAMVRMLLQRGARINLHTGLQRHHRPDGRC